MDDEQTEGTRVRICKRKDGTIFTWTPVLDALPNMRPGWLNIDVDGTRSVTLDVATSHDLDGRTMSKREQDLIDENARLRLNLAEANSLAPAAIELQPGESAITDLTAPTTEDEAPIELAEPQCYSDSTLQAMRKADLVSHLKSLDADLVVPAHLGKQDLIALCLERQDPDTPEPQSDEEGD